MILVTGGTGLVGAHLLRHLVSKGEKVRAIHRPGTFPEQARTVFDCYGDGIENADGKGIADGNGNGLFSRIEWFPADLLDIYSLDEAMKDITRVYHSAAMVSFNPADRKSLINGNIEGTANIVNLCLEHGVEKLCHVSSVSALGRGPGDRPVTEDDLWKPSKRRSAYSISKFHSEMEVWRGMEEGLNAVIVNPSVIIGPGNWKRGSARFFTAVQKGMKYYAGGMTGFVDVRDVCRCMIALMDSDISQERFILNSQELQYRELLNMIADALDRPRPVREISGPLAEAAWRLEWLRSRLTFTRPRLTREMARSSSRVNRFSNGKITGALDYRFIPIKDTVLWTAECLRRRAPG
jgi:dihydroflavonol-4-reductase